MKIEQIYTGCLAQAAYYIESEGEAVIIDPLRETEPYLRKLKEEGVTLKYIFETHFHADFVSGHIDLARKTGATIVFGPTATTGYDIRNAADGELLTVGKLTFKVLHTPGHTLESVTYLLRDEAGKDHAIFTGDTLFLGDVGRPDLAIKQGELTKENLAEMLYDSLQNKIIPLADDVIVYPAHGAGSACGKNLSKETWGYLGDQKATNYALREGLDKSTFVKEVTGGLMPPPQYFPKNAMLNKMGYDYFGDVLEKGTVALSPDRFEALVNSEGALMLDTRPQGEFVAEHIPNSIFIGINGGFAPWVGALITDLQQPIVIIAPEGREEEVVTRLSRVGYDHTLGFLEGGINAWKAADKATESIRSIAPEAFASEVKNGTESRILDVRKPTEFFSEHLDLAEAENFPLDFINTNMNQLDRDQSFYIHCAGGYRSVIAASILKSRGFQRVVDVQQGWNGIKTTELPKTNYVCASEMTDEELSEAVS